MSPKVKKISTQGMRIDEGLVLVSQTQLKEFLTATCVTSEGGKPCHLLSFAPEYTLTFLSD